MIGSIKEGRGGEGRRGGGKGGKEREKGDFYSFIQHIFKKNRGLRPLNPPHTRGVTPLDPPAGLRPAGNYHPDGVLGGASLPSRIPPDLHGETCPPASV